MWPAFSVDKLEKFTINKRQGVKTALKAMRGLRDGTRCYLPDQLQSELYLA